MHGLRIGFDVVEYSHSIYKHLTAVFDNICARLGVRRDVSCQDVDPTPHAFKTTVKDQVVPFELWPRRVVVKAAYHGLMPTTPHPTRSDARPDYPDACKYMLLFRKSMCLITPVHADVWLRTTLHMLPVNARFAFRQEADPDSILCSHGCGAVETEVHALRDCAVVAPIWDLHTTAWCGFGVGFTWYNFNSIDSFTAVNSGTLQKNALCRLWVMLTGATLHLVWHRHNLALHRQQRMPPPHVLLELSFLQWMVTARRWLRQHDADDLDRVATVAAAQLLLRRPPYHSLRAKYPRCLALESTFDVHYMS
ncbi:Aste57867_14545 [Aphanomyces stellatus]|uniref:Aste57867_14545 protein n=1 Tax=Aphanomyces stellatus TaxID=120398 RepID=A0A485L1I0_9STRA|nr:hypothetical protein As57867_014491 [Aphanomyces stellatus]VFT91367.1 Aste57867_14545 [Aphanomyces stellatus]